MNVIISNAATEIELLESINKTLNAIRGGQLFVIGILTAIAVLLLFTED